MINLSDIFKDFSIQLAAIGSKRILPANQATNTHENK